MSKDTETVLSELMRGEWPRLVAASMRIMNDLQAAEDIVQDTLLSALDHWPLGGVPDQPGAWLMTACRHRALNALRDRQREAKRIRALADQMRSQDKPNGVLSMRPVLIDDRLRLIAMCCHSVLPFDARVALTLRMVAGLSTEQIAAAFHEPTATTAQRIVRAKNTLRVNEIAFATDEIDLPARLPAVLDVLTLVFNEGYVASRGNTLTRTDLAEESHRLTTLLTVVAAAEPEPWALHALQSFHLSRWDTRTDDDGDLLTLDQQDRDRWNVALIKSGTESLQRARQLGRQPCKLLIEAELAECHARAPTFEDTDWQTIIELYDELMQLDPTPVVELNRAVAIAMRDGPAAALPTLDRLTQDAGLASSHRVWAVRADLHRRLNHASCADDDYRRALQLVGNESERAYLMQVREQLKETRS